MPASASLKRTACNRFSAALAALFLVSVIVSGCDESPGSAENYLVRAKEFRQKGELRASVIEAKNALRLDGGNQEARFILGLNYMDAGAWAPAEAMLEKAMEGTGGLEYAVIPELMRTRLNLGKFDEVFAESQIQDDMSNKLKAEILAFRGRAYTAKREFENARTAFDRATTLDAQSHSVFLGLAGLAFVERNFAETERLTDAAAKLAPDDPEILLFRGRYSLSKKKYARAKADFARLLKVRPHIVQNKILYARAQISLGETEQAAKYLDELSKIYPKNTELRYYRAMTAIQLKDYKTAAAQSELALARAPGNLAVMRLAGAAYLATGRYEQARVILTAFLERVPSDESTAKLLANIQLKLGMSNDALSTLKPWASKADAEAEVLSLIGTAALGAKDFEAGGNYFSRLVSLQPENAKARARLGLLKLRDGKADDGISELTNAVEIDGNLVNANVTLITNLIRLKKYDEALSAAMLLQSNHPKRPDGFIFAGIVEMAKNRQDAAKTAFEKAIKLDPGNSGASLGLANVYQLEKRYEHAADFLRSALEKHPKHALLLLRLAKLEARKNNLEEVSKLLSRAIEASPNMVIPRLRSGRLDLRLGKPEKALATVAPGLKLYPNDGSLLEVAGRAQLVLKRYFDARAMFERLVENHANSPQAHYLLAQAYKGLRNLDKYIFELQAAYKLDNKFYQARLDLARGLIAKNRLKEAGEHVSFLKTSFPVAPEVLTLDGDYQYSIGNYGKAVASFQAVLNKRPSLKILRNLAISQQAAGDRNGAVGTLKKWLKSKPNDILPRLQLAELLISMEQRADAIEQYEELAKKNPDLWLPYNQLAWLFLNDGKTDLAYNHARKARELAPRNPTVMDTMASILLVKGENYSALSLLRVASNAAPDDLGIKFNFARALVENDQKDEAQAILRTILGKDKDFSDREKAELLLKQLGG